MADNKDPFSEFGGSEVKIAQDPFAEFGGEPVKKKEPTTVSPEQSTKNSATVSGQQSGSGTGDNLPPITLGEETFQQGVAKGDVLKQPLRDEASYQKGRVESMAASRREEGKKLERDVAQELKDKTAKEKELTLKEKLYNYLKSYVGEQGGDVQVTEQVEDLTPIDPFKNIDLQIQELEPINVREEGVDEGLRQSVLMKNFKLQKAIKKDREEMIPVLQNIKTQSDLNKVFGQTANDINTLSEDLKTGEEKLKQDYERARKVNSGSLAENGFVDSFGNGIKQTIEANDIADALYTGNEQRFGELLEQNYVRGFLYGDQKKNVLGELLGGQAMPIGAMLTAAVLSGGNPAIAGLAGTGYYARLEAGSEATQVYNEARSQGKTHQESVALAIDASKTGFVAGGVEGALGGTFGVGELAKGAMKLSKPAVKAIFAAAADAGVDAGAAVGIRYYENIEAAKKGIKRDETEGLLEEGAAETIFGGGSQAAIAFGAFGFQILAKGARRIKSSAPKVYNQLITQYGKIRPDIVNGTIDQAVKTGEISEADGQQLKEDLGKSNAAQQKLESVEIPEEKKAEVVQIQTKIDDLEAQKENASPAVLPAIEKQIEDLSGKLQVEAAIPLTAKEKTELNKLQTAKVENKAYDKDRLKVLEKRQEAAKKAADEKKEAAKKAKEEETIKRQQEEKAPSIIVPQITVEVEFESPYTQSLKKLGYSDNQISGLTIEQQQQIVDGKIEAPVTDIKEQTVKTDSRKENVRQERIAEAHRKLDEEEATAPAVETPETQATAEQGFTEGADLNRIYKEVKAKYGDKQGAKIIEVAQRLVNPNQNTIVEVRSNGVVVKEGDKYFLKPFTNTDFNYKKWQLGKDIDVTEQFVKEEQPISKPEKVSEQEITLFKGQIGKLNADGTRRTAHPNAEGFFASESEDTAKRYSGEEKPQKITLPKGVTIEEVEVADKNKPMSEIRKEEERLINQSKAQVVKLKTMDAKGKEVQYIVKDKSLLEGEQRPSVKKAEYKIRSESTETGGITYFAYDENGDIGSIDVEKIGDKVIIDNAFVKEKYQRKGIAKSLLEQIKKDFDITEKDMEFGVSVSDEGAAFKQAILEAKPTPSGIEAPPTAETAPEQVQNFEAVLAERTDKKRDKALKAFGEQEARAKELLDNYDTNIEKLKAQGIEPTGTKAEVLADMLSGKYDEVLQQEAQPAEQVNIDRRPTTMPDGDEGIELFAISQDGTEKSIGKFYSDDTAEIEKAERNYRWGQEQKAKRPQRATEAEAEQPTGDKVGKTVSFEHAGGRVSGVVVAVDENGNLKVEGVGTNKGTKFTVKPTELYGEVTEQMVEAETKNKELEEKIKTRLGKKKEPPKGDKLTKSVIGSQQLADIPNRLVQNWLSEKVRGLENYVAKTVQRASVSDNVVKRNIADFITSLSRGIMDTQEYSQAKRQKLTGEIGKAKLDVEDFHADLWDLIGGDINSADRVHQVLDPEVSGTGLKYDDLTDAEKDLHDLLRDLNDYTHNQNFLLGKISQETYGKYKDKYIGRDYVFDDKPDQTIGGRSIKEVLGIYKQRKDLDQAMKDAAVKDPIYLTLKRYLQTAQNKAIADYSDWIFQNHGENNVLGNAVFVSDTPKDGFIKLGKGYGALSNKYVARNVAEDFGSFVFNNEFMSLAYDAFKAYDGLPPRQFMKELLTVGNPQVQLGNATSNIVFSWLGGVDFPTYISKSLEARRQIKERGDVYRFLTDEGLLGSDFISKDLKPMETVIGGEPTTTFGKARKKLRSVYSGVDDAAKIQMFLSLKDMGYTDQQAVTIVFESMQNYQNTGRIWDFASKTPIIGNSFVKFTPEMLRLLKNGMTRRPLHTLAFVSMLSTLPSIIGKNMGDDDEEIDAAAKMKGIPKITIPYTDLNIPLSWRIGDKRVNLARFLMPMYIYDIGGESRKATEFVNKFMPYQLKETETGGLNPFNVQDPFVAPIISILQNKDFRDKPIAEETDNTFDATLKRLRYATRGYGGFYANMIDDIFSTSITGEDFYGRRKTALDVALNTLIKVETFDDERLKQGVIREFDGYERMTDKLYRAYTTKRKKIDGEVKEIKKDKTLSEERKKELIAMKQQDLMRVSSNILEEVADVQKEMIEATEFYRNLSRKQKYSEISGAMSQAERTIKNRMRKIDGKFVKQFSQVHIF